MHNVAKVGFRNDSLAGIEKGRSTKRELLRYDSEYLTLRQVRTFPLFTT